MTLDPKVQRIVEWRESFATLPDAHFFELIRMYLGEVKTPYNKQKLIEELGSFIRKDENKKNLVLLLDDTDLEIISAVKYIPKVTQEKLASFFTGVFSYALLYEHVLNLEERLILYRRADKTTGAVLVDVNPLLEETLEPYVSINRLLPQTVFSQKNDATPFMINPQFIASFFSFALAHPDMCKDDGTFKKRTLGELNDVYSNGDEDESMQKRLQLLVNALCALGIFHETEQGISVDMVRLTSFATLPELVQYVYLCVASTGHLSRNTMLLNAQLLRNTLASVPPDGFTKNVLLRLGFLLREKSGVPTEETGRFAAMVAASSAFADKNSAAGDSGLFECFVDSCISFGILYDAGRNEADQTVYAVSPLFAEQNEAVGGENKVLSIDAAFTVTIMPGLSLAQLIPLVIFMDSVKYDTAAVFEINRKAVLRSFDLSCTPTQIFSLLQKYSQYDIPQNLSMCIDDWYNSYASVSLYKGYVLKVTNDDGGLPAEKNPLIAPFIKQILAPGVFLLTISNDDEAKLLVQKSGLDAIGTIKTAQTEGEIASLPDIAVNESLAVVARRQETKKQKMDGSDLIVALKKELDELKISAEQKEGLEDRIDRKIILNEVQLRGTSVRLEKLEANGMDYNGKLHVIDSAMVNKCMIELECEGSDAVLVGTPVLLTKKNDNAIVRVCLEPDHSVRDISVGAATRIKKLRGTILK